MNEKNQIEMQSDHNNSSEESVLKQEIINEFTSISYNTLNPNSFNQILAIIKRRLISTSRECNTIVLILIPCFLMGFIAIMFSFQIQDANFKKLESVYVIFIAQTFSCT